MNSFQLAPNFTASDQLIVSYLEGFLTRSRTARAFPAIATIVRDTGVGRSTVFECLNRLTPAVLTREKRQTRHRDGWQQNEYRAVGAFARHCKRVIAAKAAAAAARARRMADDVAAMIDRGRDAVRRQAVNAYRAAIWRKKRKEQVPDLTKEKRAPRPETGHDLSKISNKKASCPVATADRRRNPDFLRDARPDLWELNRRKEASSEERGGK